MPRLLLHRAECPPGYTIYVCSNGCERGCYNKDPCGTKTCEVEAKLGNAQLSTSASTPASKTSSSASQSKVTSTATTATTSLPSTSASTDTHVPRPSTIMIMTTSFATTTVVPQLDPPAENSTNVGAIAGGVVGGILGLVIVALLGFFLLRRHKRMKEGRDSLGQGILAAEQSSSLGYYADKPGPGAGEQRYKNHRISELYGTHDPVEAPANILPVELASANYSAQELPAGREDGGGRNTTSSRYSELSDGSLSPTRYSAPRKPVPGVMDFDTRRRSELPGCSEGEISPLTPK